MFEHFGQKTHFTLDPDFVTKYAAIPDKEVFSTANSFGVLSWLTYARTYSRVKRDAELYGMASETNERWWETIRRVVEGTYRMQEGWVRSLGLPWDPSQAQRSAKEMFDRMFHRKFLPPGRGLWAMGSPITYRKGLYEALNNCGYISTEPMAYGGDEAIKPFTTMMNWSMLSVGVGFGTQGAGRLEVAKPAPKKAGEVFVVPDTREGWVEAITSVLRSYFKGEPWKRYDLSLLRPEGSPIKTFGGTSSGPEPLRQLIQTMLQYFEARIGTVLGTKEIMDLMNMIGRCIVSGNVRRSAQIAFAPLSNDEFVRLKDYKLYPDREPWGWASNNSVIVEPGETDYQEYTRALIEGGTGEPGIFWRENARNYGRMTGEPDFADYRAEGTNPCGEQTLEPFELCCLVETYPCAHVDEEDFRRTLKFAFLYAKTVGLGNVGLGESNRVLLRNRRIGVSMSGIADFIHSRGLNTLHKWATSGYHVLKDWDRIYSEWLCVRESIKITSVKPSGTVSLLTGSSPGMHYHINDVFLRRVRIARSSELIPILQRAGYPMEPQIGHDETMVVSIPVKLRQNSPLQSSVSMMHQLGLAQFLQREWADNQVSCTITVKPDEMKNVQSALTFAQYAMKSVSFLPEINTDQSPYPQMPYQPITNELYEEIMAQLKPIETTTIHGEVVDPERGCDGTSCSL